MKIIMEIRPGEGGQDSKLLLIEQSKIYMKYAEQNNINIKISQDSF